MMNLLKKSATSTIVFFSLAGSAAAGPALDAYLDRAIQRGAPLFNEGMPAACAAIYATALEAIAESEGWGIEADQQATLTRMLDRTDALLDPAEQAWAYRRIIDTLLSGEPLRAPEVAQSLMLFDFTKPEQFQDWRVVVDGVMGGRSTGRLEKESESLVFTGSTSLQNNGGFSSIRAAVPPGALAGYDALRIRVKGDGRTWIIGASTRTDARGDSYWARFDTTRGEWQTVTVPLAEMVRQYFGTPIRGRLQPARVRGVEFYIYDKQAGPFSLEVDQIEAVMTGLDT